MYKWFANYDDCCYPLIIVYSSLQYICVTSEVNAIPPFTQIEIAKKEAKQTTEGHFNAGHVFTKIFTLFELKPSCFWRIKVKCDFDGESFRFCCIFDVIDIFLNIFEC